MKMFRIIYVLSSDEKDYYYQQLMVSLKSLRTWMKDITVTVLVDQETDKTLNGTRLDILKFAEVKVIEVPERYSKKERSRYLKTSMRKYITGDFLFVDSDTVICDDFSDTDFNCVMAMVPDRNCFFEQKDDKGENIKNIAKNCGFDLSSCNVYFNSGVIWCRECTETQRFFELWHESWKKTLKSGMCVDQLSLNHVICNEMNIVDILDGVWNCQISLRPGGIKYIANAHIMHYFNTNPNSAYLMCDESLIRNYSENDIIDEIINNPRTAFRQSYLIAYGSNEDIVINSRQSKLLKELYYNHHRIYTFNEKILGILTKLKNLIRPAKRWEKY